jgi:tyrosine-protein phosphatase YwqE
MFKFFSRSSSAAFDFSLLGTDMHSHILPGIDDGARDLDMSVELVKGMSGLGYKRLIGTPHVMWGIYSNTAEIIREKLQLLRQRLQQEQIQVSVEAAAEYFLDDHVAGLISTNTPLLKIGGNMVLVEFSLAHPTLDIKDTLFAMQMQGYQPVIAHPERYIYLERSREFYDELKDIGCLFQLNILSVAGGYGKSVQALAEYLIKRGYYDLAGTDLHHPKHIEALRSPALVAPLQKLVDSGKLRNRDI